jgi:hypothetical protein
MSPPALPLLEVRRLTLTAARALIACMAGLVAETATAAIDFNRDIKPILADRCYSCHGPDKHKSGLRLDRQADALQGGDSGVVIVPRDSGKSPLYAHISGGEPDAIMPPESEGKPLSSEQIALIKQWIDEGATWPEQLESGAEQRSAHWAFQPPAKPRLRAVQNAAWTRNAIDRFVLARLERDKIKPSAEADRSTLLRRLSFDLLGLPPTPEQVRAFVADQRPDAYERAVDEMLASPHFGERWGRHWLDLARYADSDGYEKDSPRPYAYLYRDWVIGAINRDLPFDQFTVEQLAGDLLPHPTRDQKIATGFHRQTLINREGGVDQEEFRNKAVVDRVDTTGTVWLGLTVGCAECHSHKYDPLTQREFYQLFAFFNNADDEDLSAPSAAELEKYRSAKAAYDQQRAPLAEAYETYVRDGLPAKQAEWETTGKVDLPVWAILAPSNVRAAEGATMGKLTDNTIAATGMNPLTETYTVETASVAGPITGFRLEVLPEDKGRTGPGRSGNGNFVLTEFTVKVKPAGGGEPREIPLKNATADFAQKDWAPAGAIDGKKESGWAIAPQTKQRHVLTMECAEPLSLAAGDTLVFTLDQQFGNQHTIGRFRLSASQSESPLKPTLIDDLVAVAWNTPAGQRTAAHQAALHAYYRDGVDAEARKLRKPLQDLLKKEPKYPETKAAILAERASPRETHVHIRGDFQRPGPRVQPGTPAALHAFKARGEKPDRLDLARWLVDDANPLTRRVTVNHVWKNLFGRGIVPSVSNFGLQGERPSHPELLDWLANEFGSTLGWSRKALIKLVVTSATYRQSSAYRDDLVDVDPLNTLLARQNRLRLEAEVVRDTHLAASGLLTTKIGGPSVRPPLPADIAALGYANSVKWQESEGEDRYRRGMYIFFQRTVPYPMLMTFDAPNANTTCTRRDRSNTPLQALTLWNDPVFFDCARALAGRVMNHATVETRLERAFELCLARSPSAAEAARLKQFYEDQLRLTREQPKSAPSILGLNGDVALPADPAEQATLVAAVRTIMNLDEFITRE